MPNDSYEVPPGMSIADLIQAELDTAYVEFRKREAIARENDAGPLDADMAWFSRGEAAGLSKALAILRNPYHPDLSAVKRETVERNRT